MASGRSSCMTWPELLSVRCVLLDDQVIFGLHRGPGFLLALELLAGHAGGHNPDLFHLAPHSPDLVSAKAPDAEHHDAADVIGYFSVE